MKVIVTQRIDYIENYGEKRESIDQALSEWLIQLYFLPVPISNKLVIVHNDKDKQVKEQPILQNFLTAIKPGALLISGGNDIGEYPQRDATEHYLLNWARDQRIPVLGICRGLQIMATWAGSELVEVINHVKIHHELIFRDEYGDFPQKVNSYHNWGLDVCPKDFMVTARAKDGSIEAIKHKELPWEAWMWHPERETPFLEQDTRRLKALFVD